MKSALNSAPSSPSRLPFSLPPLAFSISPQNPQHLKAHQASDLTVVTYALTVPRTAPPPSSIIPQPTSPTPPSSPVQASQTSSSQIQPKKRGLADKQRNADRTDFCDISHH